MSKAKKLSGLEAVHNLYLMQMELMGYLKESTLTQDQAKDAQKCLRQFKSLLGEVDPNYMGGEDVFETLREIQEEMSQRLKARSARSKAAKKAVKTTTKVKKVKKA
tara:strand:+ start:327 stop:644 length:318 start_codon:yes stop_codon:yes gene_type:complete